jgi:hypothetical protein
LKKHRLTMRPKKCHFEVPKVTYLGLIISHNSVHHSPKKCSGILTWLHPTKLKELQQFLGLLNYYCQFIPHFAEKAAPLYKLTGRDAWIRTDAQE